MNTGSNTPLYGKNILGGNANSVPIGVYGHELSGKAKGQDDWNGASANDNQYLATGVREADEVCLGHNMHSGLFLCVQIH